MRFVQNVGKKENEERDSITVVDTGYRRHFLVAIDHVFIRITAMISAREVVLLSILDEGPRDTDGLRLEYTQSTKRVFPLGSIYTTLNRMIGKNLVERTKHNRKNKYSITKHGREELTAFRQSCKRDG